MGFRLVLLRGAPALSIKDGDPKTDLDLSPAKFV